MRKSLGSKALSFPEPVLMIATYNEDGSVDCMNAAWGCMCDYDKITICLDKSHKTVENILKNKALTVSFADEKHMIESDYLGLVSANKVKDKFLKTKMKAVKSEKVNAPIIEDYPICLECELISYDNESEMMVAKIVDVTVDTNYLDENGKVDLQKVKPLSYDPFNHNYMGVGKVVGKAFNEGRKIED